MIDGLDNLVTDIRRDPKGTAEAIWNNIANDPGKAAANLGVNLLFGAGMMAGKAPVKTPVKSPGTFPTNPSDLLPGVSRTVKPNGNQIIHPSDRIRIRAETHPIKPGETHAPRHHDLHYHVEIRLDPTKSWNNPNNVKKVLPPNYKPGHGTGFLPGETFPGK